MQHDDTIWSVISQGFCSFKMKLRDDVGHAGAKTEALCRNPYNITGQCSRANCPLANSQYATVVEHANQLYLYIKTVERAHTPKRLWEKILLPSNFKAALAIINDNLQWWDRKVVMKCKHRLLRLKQVLIRKRRLAARGTVKLVGIKKKEEKQLDKKEKKAATAAAVETGIRKELISRLKKGEQSIDVPDEELEKLADQLEDGEIEHEIEGEDEDGEDALSDAYTADLSDSDEESEEESEEELSETEAEKVGQKRVLSASNGRAKRRYVEIEEEKESEWQ
eukprot:gene11221-17258_t